MIKTILKDWVLPAAIIGALYFTGLLGQFTTFAQGMVLKSGIYNAGAESNVKETFNYNQKAYNSEGELITLSEFKGKVIFLNLWATWCGPCKAEMPGINSLYEDLKDNESIEFVMLSIDRNESAPHRYIKKYNYTFPYYHWNGPVTSQLSVGSIPTTFVVSKTGEIIRKEIGMARYNTKSFKNFLLKESAR